MRLKPVQEASDDPDVMSQAKTEKTLPYEPTFTIKPTKNENGTPKDNTFMFNLHFTEPGTYHYVINEKRPEGGDGEFSGINGVTYDPMQYHVIVKVTDDDDNGELESKVTTVWVRNTNARGFWPDENLLDKTEEGKSTIVFENTYNPDEVARFFLVKKSLTNKVLESGSYQFVLTPQGVSDWIGSEANFTACEKISDQPMPTVIYGKAENDDDDVGEVIQPDENGNIVVGNGPSGHVTFDGIKFTAEHDGENHQNGKVYKYIVYEQQPTVDGTMTGEPLEGAKLVDGQWV